MVTKEDKQANEARAALDRLKREGGVFDSAMPAGKAKSDPDAKRRGQEADAIERWGRIVGRTLGWAAALFLAWQLFSTFGG
jgi:hypothetical protein